MQRPHPGLRDTVDSFERVPCCCRMARTTGYTIGKAWEQGETRHLFSLGPHGFIWLSISNKIRASCVVRSCVVRCAWRKN
jgi:hypothetical protein